MENRKYYYIHFKDEQTGIAYANPSSEMEHLDHLAEIPFEFQLRGGPLRDYQPNNLGWPLMSPRLRVAIESSVRFSKIVWLRAKIRLRDNSEVIYWVPRFTQKFDVLSPSRSVMAGGDFVVKAHLDKQKVKQIDFFPIPESESRLVIAEEIKRHIELQGLTGIDFGFVPMS